jgi:hypothetical protein
MTVNKRVAAPAGTPFKTVAFAGIGHTATSEPQAFVCVKAIEAK